jgi:hypothetical protein
MAVKYDREETADVSEFFVENDEVSDVPQFFIETEMPEPENKE